MSNISDKKLILIERTQKGTIKRFALEKVLLIPAQSGANYTLIEESSQKPPKGLVLRHEEGKLIVDADCERVVEVIDFYSQQAVSFTTDGSIAPVAGSANTINASTPAVSVLSASESIVWDESNACVVAAAPFNTNWIVGGGALALAVGSAAARSADSGPAPYTISVLAVAGTFNSDASVEIYDKDGKFLAKGNLNPATGQFVATITSGYSGPLFVKVIDSNGATADYLDEATGQQRTFTTTLRALAMADGSGNVAVTVSPLTELAARTAGIPDNFGTPGVVNAPLTAADVSINQQIGKLFGLTDITGPVVTITDAAYSEANGISAAETYGQVLAALSGADATTGGIDATIKALAHDIVSTGTGTLAMRQTAVDLVTKGATVFEAGVNGAKASLVNVAALAPPVVPEAAGGLNVAEAANGTLVDVDVTGATAGAALTLKWGNQSVSYTLNAADISSGIAHVPVSASVIAAAGEGELAVTSQIDAQAVSPAVLILVDTTAPGAGTVALTTDSGSNATDRVTNDAALTLSPLAAGLTRTYVVDGGTANANYIAPTADGNHTVVVIDSDAAGNSASASLSFTLDKTGTAPTLTLSNDSGSSATDHLTIDAALTLSPLAAGMTRSYVVDGGTASANYNAPITEGPHNVVVTDTDVAGNSASASLGFTLFPTVPAPTVALSTDTGSSATDKITNNNAALDLNKPASGITRSFSVDGGAASASYLAPTADGSHTVVVTDTDTAGNSASTSLTFTRDTTIATPTAALSNDSGSSSTDKITNNAGLALSAAAADVTRTFSVDGGAASGSYSAPSADGTHTVLVTDTDIAGNSANTSLTFTLDRTIATPTVALTTDSTDGLGNHGTDAITNNAALSFSATASGVTRSISVDSGAGSASYTAPTADGSHTVLVTDTDIAGNTVSSSLTFTRDSTVATPTLALSTDSTDGGTGHTTDLVSNVATLVTSGTESGATVQYSSNGSTWASSFTPAQGSNTAYVRQTDIAGNVSAASSAFTFTYDNVNPAAPAGGLLDLIAASDTGGSSTDNNTSATTPTFDVGVLPSVSNPASAITGVKLYVAGVEVAATWDAANHRITPTVPLADGTHAITFAYVDLAGNVGAQSAALSVTVGPLSVVVNATGAHFDDNGDGVLQAGETAVASLQGNADLAAGRVTIHVAEVPPTGINVTGFGTDDRLVFHVKELVAAGDLPPGAVGGVVAAAGNDYSLGAANDVTIATGALQVGGAAVLNWADGNANALSDAANHDHVVNNLNSVAGASSTGVVSFVLPKYVVVDSTGAFIDTDRDGVLDGGETTPAVFASGGNADLSKFAVTVHVNDAPASAMNFNGFGGDDRLEFDVSSLIANGKLAGDAMNNAVTAAAGVVDYNFAGQANPLEVTWAANAGAVKIGANVFANWNAAGNALGNADNLLPGNNNATLPASFKADTAGGNVGFVNYPVRVVVGDNGQGVVGAYMDANGNGIVDGTDASNAASFTTGGNADLAAKSIVIHFNDVPATALSLTGFGAGDKVEIDVQSFVDNQVWANAGVHFGMASGNFTHLNQFGVKPLLPHKLSTSANPGTIKAIWGQSAYIVTTGAVEKHVSSPGVHLGNTNLFAAASNGVARADMGQLASGFGGTLSQVSFVNYPDIYIGVDAYGAYYDVDHDGKRDVSTANTAMWVTNTGNGTIPHIGAADLDQHTTWLASGEENNVNLNDVDFKNARVIIQVNDKIDAGPMNLTGFGTDDRIIFNVGNLIENGVFSYGANQGATAALGGSQIGYSLNHNGAGRGWIRHTNTGPNLPTSRLVLAHDSVATANIDRSGRAYTFANWTDAANPLANFANYYQAAQFAALNSNKALSAMVAAPQLVDIVLPTPVHVIVNAAGQWIDANGNGALDGTDATTHADFGLGGNASLVSKEVTIRFFDKPTYNLDGNNVHVPLNLSAFNGDDKIELDMAQLYNNVFQAAGKTRELFYAANSREATSSAGVRTRINNSNGAGAWVSDSITPMTKLYLKTNGNSKLTQLATHLHLVDGQAQLNAVDFIPNPAAGYGKVVIVGANGAGVHGVWIDVNKDLVLDWHDTNGNAQGSTDYYEVIDSVASSADAGRSEFGSGLGDVSAAAYAYGSGNAIASNANSDQNVKLSSNNVLIYVKEVPATGSLNLSGFNSDDRILFDMTALKASGGLAAAVTQVRDITRAGAHTAKVRFGHGATTSAANVAAMTYHNDGVWGATRASSGAAVVQHNAVGSLKLNGNVIADWSASQAYLQAFGNVFYRLGGTNNANALATVDFAHQSSINGVLVNQGIADAWYMANSDTVNVKAVDFINAGHPLP